MEFYLAKHGLNKTWDLRQIGLSFLRDQKRGEEGEKRKREKKRKRRRREEKQSQTKVWKLTLIMDSMRFGMNLWFCMIIILSKPRVLLGFILTQ